MSEKKTASITKAECRVLIKMWIRYCSDYKDDSDLRIQMLFEKYKVGKFINDLDKVLEYTLSDDNMRLVSLMLLNLETLAYEVTKGLSEEEYNKETTAFRFKHTNYYILKSDVELISKIIYQLK